MSVGQKDRARLGHMLKAARNAIDFAGTEHDAFVGSELVQSAVIHQLLVLGEAAKNVSPEGRGELPGLPWREMARMRDVLIHHYFGVRLKIVWDVVGEELPGLVEDLELFLESETA